MSPLAVSNWELMLGLGFACVLMAAYGYVYWRLDRYVRRKGYQSPFRAAFFVGLFVAMVVLGFLNDARHPESCWTCSPAANPDYFAPELMWPHVRRFVVNFTVGTTALLAVTLLGTGLVPKRARRGGRRRVRFPWNAAGLLCLLTVPAMAVLALAGYAGWSHVLRTIAPAMIAHAGCRYLAKRSKVEPLERVLQDDPRPPVLYLRPFEREDDYFAVLRNQECESAGVPIRNPSAFRQTSTFEEFFAKEITERIGPFVALGDPYDYLPPGGAARAYLEDADWQPFFLAMARDSACIVTALGSSENLQWELRSLRAAGWHTKLFVLTSPRTDGHWYSVQWGRSVKRQWKPFAAELERCEFLAGEYPGDGAVISFDSTSRAVAIATSCKMPADYIAAIDERLRQVAVVENQGVGVDKPGVAVAGE